MTSEKIGNDTNPKYKLQANVFSLDSGYSKDDVTYLFYRKIEGVDPDYKLIHRGDEIVITDEPFANKQEIKNYKLLSKKEVAAMALDNQEIVKPYGEKFEKLDSTFPRVKRGKKKN